MKRIKSVSIISLGILLINVPTFQKVSEPNLNSWKFFEIKYEDLIKQKTIAKLSQLASNVEYIRLETNEDCMVYNNAKYYFTDNFIFVKNRDHILKFSYDGKFIKKIGNPGRGPGEITSITTTSIIPEKKLIAIYDFVAHKLRFFDFDGKMLKTVNLAPYNYVKVLKNNTYIAINQVRSVASEKFSHLLLSESGDTISTVKNYETWKSFNQNRILTIGSPSFEPFYIYQNNPYFKSMYNDTVYVVSDNRIAPAYFINLGKYRIPEEKRYERSIHGDAKLFDKDAAGYYYAYVLEAGGKLFLTANEWGGNSDLVYFLINKKAFIENADNKYSSTFKGYIDNDWDGGAVFWPKGSINDNKVYMPIYAADLKNVINFRRTSNSLKTMVKYPDKRTELEKMASEIDISDNPLLMIVTLKND
jgi:hypothetical protein